MHFLFNGGVVLGQIGVVAAGIGYNQSVALRRGEFLNRRLFGDKKVQFVQASQRYSGLVQQAAGLVEIYVFGVLRRHGFFYRRGLSVKVQTVQTLRNQ